MVAYSCLRLEQETSTISCIHVDKRAAVTIHCDLESSLSINAAAYQPRVGDVVVCRVLSEHPSYSDLELTSGRMARLKRGDVIAGVLGSRRALHGFVGEVPSFLKGGMHVHLLNRGGVIGACSSSTHQLSEAITLEFLGRVWRDEQALCLTPGLFGGTSSTSFPANLSNSDHVSESPQNFEDIPVIFVAGTCMNSGKTQVARELVKHFVHLGQRVAAGKLTGVASLQDTLEMSDQGACITSSFLDFGYPSTIDVANLPIVAKKVLVHLRRANPQVIVLEMGGGLLDDYGVDVLLGDRELMSTCSS
ncbi:MAG: hypothetical protein AAGJ35_11890, partial [Myxococcota bacterium]